MKLNIPTGTKFIPEENESIGTYLDMLEEIYG